MEESRSSPALFNKEGGLRAPFQASRDSSSKAGAEAMGAESIVTGPSVNPEDHCLINCWQSV